jgi:hypothetical protein
VRTVIYVPDAKLVAPVNLALLDQAGRRFVSRLPDTYGPAGQIKRKALADGILEDNTPFVLAHAADPKRYTQYRVRKYVDRLGDRTYAVVVIASSSSPRCLVTRSDIWTASLASRRPTWRRYLVGSPHAARFTASACPIACVRDEWRLRRPCPPSGPPTRRPARLRHRLSGPWHDAGGQLP